MLSGSRTGTRFKTDPCTASGSLGTKETKKSHVGVKRRWSRGMAVGMGRAAFSGSLRQNTRVNADSVKMDLKLKVSRRALPRGLTHSRSTQHMSIKLYVDLGPKPLPDKVRSSGSKAPLDSAVLVRHFKLSCLPDIKPTAPLGAHIYISMFCHS